MSKFQVLFTKWHTANFLELHGIFWAWRILSFNLISWSFICIYIYILISELHIFLRKSWVISSCFVFLPLFPWCNFNNLHFDSVLTKERAYTFWYHVLNNCLSWELSYVLVYICWYQKILHSLKSKNDSVKYSGRGEQKQQKLLQCSRTLFVTRLIKANKHSRVIYKCLSVERIF